ncbi:MAG: efflux RND transporter periplasmic adaptor subunit, partial [Planctomycetaceae bacterium]|nr:efflux RND transporter periplasmic adaptor subunit [Planctomycetaceae bacterium]
MNLTSPKSGLVFRGVNRLLPALFVAGILAAGSYVVMRVESPAAADSDAVADADVGESSDTGNAELTEVTLTPVKFSYAGIQTETAGLRTIEDVRTVSGRLTYDEARHIELRSPVDGVLADVLVKPGDAVAEGQLLAVINSPEVGRARSSVLTAGAAREVVQQRVKRAEEIRGNLGSLFAMLDRKASVEEIERQFSNRSLGSYREDIVAAYSELQLADQLTAAAAPLTETGSLPLRTLRERHNDRHVANARFQSVWETTEFDVQLQKQQLAAEDAAAQRE